MNKNFTGFIRTVSYLMMWVFVVCIAVVPAVVIALLPKKWRLNKVVFWFQYSIMWLLLKATFLPVTIEGMENIPQDPVVFVANHQSALDIPMIGVVVGTRPNIWMSWSGNLRFPVFGWIISRLAIIVNQDSPRQAVESLYSAAETLKTSPLDLLIFPEGGRFVDGTVHKFFRGFAVVAEETGRKVVPVALFNPGKVNPPRSFWIYDYPLRIVVGQPFTMNPGETAQDFAERVRGWFQMQEPLC